MELGKWPSDDKTLKQQWPSYSPNIKRSMGIAVESHTHLDFTEIKGYTLTVLILLNPTFQNL